MKRLLRYIKPYLAIMFVGLTIKMSGALGELVIPRIMTHIIDEIVPMADALAILKWGLLMLLCAVFCAGYHYNSIIARNATQYFV